MYTSKSLSFYGACHRYFETLYSKRQKGHGRSACKNGVGEPVRGDYQARLFQLQKLD